MATYAVLAPHRGWRCLPTSGSSAPPVGPVLNHRAGIHQRVKRLRVFQQPPVFNHPRIVARQRHESTRASPAGTRRKLPATAAV